MRTALTISGIALGVAVMLAINLANTTALSRFREGVDLVAGQANLQVRPVAGADLDERILSKMSWLYDEEVRVSPAVEDFALVWEKEGDLVQILGVDIFAGKEVYGIGGQVQSGDGGLSILEARSALFGPELALRHKLKVGDSLQLVVNDKLESINVKGVLDLEGLGRAYGGNVIIMDIGVAQDLLRMGGRLSRIDLIVPSEKLPLIQKSLQGSLGSAYSVERPQRRGEQVEKMLRAFQYNLTALSVIAMLAGMFLIYNTMSIAVIRRRPQIGTLRALGLKSELVFFLFVAEGLFLGVIGSLSGLLLGVGFAGSAVSAVGRTVRALYADQPPAELTIPFYCLLLAFCFGIFITLVAVLAPAAESVSISPAEAARPASYERKVASVSKLLGALGILFLGLSLIFSMQPAWNGFPVFGYMSAAACIFGVSFCLPFLLGYLLRSLAQLLRVLFGSTGFLATRALHGAIGRTAVAVASLMLGIAMMVSLAIMIGSFRSTVITWVNQTLKADLWIEPLSRSASSRVGKLDPSLVEIVRRAPGVDLVDAFIEFPMEFRGQPANLGAGELDVLKERGNLLFLDNEPAKAVLSRMQTGDSAIITESFAIKHRVRKGDFIELPSPKGTFSVKVEGIYFDYSSDSGYVILSRPCFGRHFEDDASTTLAVFLKDGVEAEFMRRMLVNSLPADARLRIRTNKELKEQVLKVFDNTFSITYALHAISILVAILGVMNALFSLTMESRRDLGIMRYLGASSQQLQRLILVQAGLLGGLGTSFGFSLGLVLSFLLINVINKQSFGWTVQFALPAEFLGQSIILIMVSAIVSGLLPAKFAALAANPEVLRSE